MAANLKFNADVRKFAELCNDRIETVLTGVGVATFKWLAEATPYRSGRARASWNIDEGTSPKGIPAVELPGNRLDATDAELEAAQEAYDHVYKAKLAYEAPDGTDALTISNNLHYIENLNAGSSRQAPAGFFEATMAGMEALVNSQVQKLKK